MLRSLNSLSVTLIAATSTRLSVCGPGDRVSASLALTLLRAVSATNGYESVIRLVAKLGYPLRFHLA